MQKVLIIEDDNHTRDGLKELLQLEGYQVETAADGSSAAVVYDSDVEIIIADYRLPDTNGVCVIKQLTEAGRSATTILVTSFLTSEIVHQANDAGINTCMSKPLNIEELLSAMQKSCEFSNEPVFKATAR